MSEKPTCESCRFSLFPNDDMECHRNAPNSVIAGNFAYHSAWWPIVSFNDWCGEFQYSHDIQELDSPEPTS